MANAIVLLLAAILDRLLGDPWCFPHPVQLMGYGIEIMTRISLQQLSSPLAQLCAGVAIMILTVGGTIGIASVILFFSDSISPWLGGGVAVIMTASCFAEKSLEDAARSVLVPLAVGDLDRARSVLSQYVGRDTANLSESEVLRAVLETVAENCTDGVIAPLFYAIIGGAPLALGYKALSTLDSMIGYKSSPYTYIGRFSARSEDVATWLPCRLTVILIAILSGKPRSVWQICARDAPQDPSPNSGWSESVFAATLEVQLGGKNFYKGVLKEKPLLGIAKHPITPEKIQAALDLMRTAFWITIGVGVILQTFR